MWYNTQKGGFYRLTIYIANGIALIGSVLLVIAGVVKTKNRTVWLHTGQLVLASIANFLLSAYTGAVLNIISIFRNAIVLRNCYNNIWRFVFCLIIVFAGLFVNNRGVVGLLTIIGNITYTVFLGTTAKRLKLALAFCIFCWCVYDFSVQNYVSAMTDIIIGISSLIGFMRIIGEERDGEKNNI